MRSVTVKGGTFSKGELEVAAGAEVELTITASRGLGKVAGELRSPGCNTLVAIDDGRYLDMPTLL